MAAGAGEKGTDEQATAQKSKKTTKKGEGTRAKRASRTAQDKSSVAASIQMDDSAMQSEQFNDIGQDLAEVRVAGDGDSVDDGKNAANQ